jgi:carbon-monoxide dehydrogenase large subunit/6-hydroxypseudooxynicotine dehydrogenase subunit gamma
MTGSATHIAATKIRTLALETAAQLLQSTPAELTITEGRVHRTTEPVGPSLSLGEIARELAAGADLLINGGDDAGLAAEGWFHTDHMVYPYGVHVAVVAIDRGTGGVTVERYLIAYDVGRAVNPMLVEGQLVGGLAQGLGGCQARDRELERQSLHRERGSPRSPPANPHSDCSQSRVRLSSCGKHRRLERASIC